MDNLYIGAIQHNARTALEWNIALDGNGQPELPGSNSCSNPPCRGIVTISGSSYTLNQEFYSMAQASKAILPRDVNGPFGQRIGVSVGGSEGVELRVNAFVTGRVNPSDWLRYSLVVMNWYDNINGNWNPQQVTATIEFRGMQATYTFPVGVTTLWWYAPASSSAQVVSTKGFSNATASPEISVSGTTVTPSSKPQAVPSPPSTQQNSTASFKVVSTSASFTSASPSPTAPPSNTLNSTATASTPAASTSILTARDQRLFRFHRTP